MLNLYEQVCFECSTNITKRYSTSFSTGIRVFNKAFRAPIYSIYGFVRFADEIVDTFHGFEKKELLSEFRRDVHLAIERKISINPILHSFQSTVHEYEIETSFIDAFLDSMEMDLSHSTYKDELYKTYIYGSAEVVGLMCLRVFLKNKNEQFEKLKPYAQALGSAFQKINFLRDMKSDFEERGRVYFPGVDFENFSSADKEMIEADIKADFDKAYLGIIELPKGARLGVYLAYVYYINLFHKIKKATVTKVKEERIRVPDRKKAYLLFSSMVKHTLNIL